VLINLNGDEDRTAAIAALLIMAGYFPVTASGIMN
jgi:hypothetical protein